MPARHIGPWCTCLVLITGLIYVWLTRDHSSLATAEYRTGEGTPSALPGALPSTFDGDLRLRLARLRKEAPVSIQLGDDFLQSILSADNSAVTVALPGGGTMTGRVSTLRRDDQGPLLIEGVVTAPEAGKFMFQRQTVPGKAGPLVGFIHYDKSETAYKVSPQPDSGKAALFKTTVGEVICRAFPPRNGPAEIPPTHPTDFPIPPGENGIIQLQSLPGAPAVVYLDYDGEERNFNLWGYINAQPFGADAAQIFNVWKGVSEDFQPFNINITTIRAVYDSAPEGRRMHVIVTPTDTASPGSGGVAYVGSYNWSGEMVCWAFYGIGKDAVEIISHEVGHTLGLSHHGTSEGEYYEGHPGWAPIMGVGYYQNPSQWSEGEYPDAFAYNNSEEGLQDDLAIITTANNDVAYRADDHGNTFATATWLEIDTLETVSNEGVVESAADGDAFRFSTTGGTLSLQIDPVVSHPNLDIKAEILDSGGAPVAVHDPQNSQAAFFSAQYLIAGDYFLRVSGVGRGDLATGYSDYASLGAYTITGTINGGVPSDRFSIPENSPPATVAGAVTPRVSHGAGVLSYAILSGNTGSSFSIDPLTGEITVASDLLLDFESLSTRWDDPAVFELFVEISDDLLVATETIRTVITVTDVNEAPVFPTLDAVLVAEQSAVGTEVANVTATDPDRGDHIAFSIEAGNTGGAFFIDAETGVITVASPLDFETTPSYSLTLRATDQLVPANTVDVSLTINLLDLPENLTPGGAMQTFFRDIPGDEVGALTLSPAFPGQPHSERLLDSFDSGPPQGDSYGSTVRGHLIAPTTGDYTFWISADDSAELYISTDHTPPNKVLRASIDHPANRGEWEKFESQESSAINLVAGQIYYIEARHKESAAGDHIQVAWQGPGTAGRGIIPGRWLIPFEENYAPWAMDATLAVRESAEDGQYVGSLNFTEPDEGETIISYVITSGNDSGVFAINPSTGAITLADTAEVTDGDSWTLEISATDNGTPALTGHATANIVASGLNEGLHAWWKLDGSSNINVPDSSGNQRHAVLDGAPAWVTRDQANSALELNGIDAGVIYPGLDALAAQTSFTVAAWVKIPSSHSTDATLLQQQGSDPGGNIGSWHVQVTSAGAVRFGLFGRDAEGGNEGHQFDITSSGTIDDGQWHHVACVREGETGRIFIDGILQGAGSGIVRMLSPELSLAAGWNVLTGNSHLEATIDDIRIYSQALGAPQIVRIAGTPKAGILSPVAAVADIPPGVGIMLTATGSDPDGPTPSFAWSLVSGPGTVDFGTPGAAETSALFSLHGTYVLRVTASDGLNSEATDVIVNAGITASSAFAGSSYGVGTAGSHFSTGPDSTALLGSAASLLNAGTSDGFYLLGQNFSGDFDIRTRIVAVDNVIDTDDERAGLIIRAGTAGDADEAGGFIGFDSAGGLRTLTRATSGGANSEMIVGSFPIPQWCRITRVGTEVKLWHSQDGSVWNFHGSIHLSGEVRAGLCWSSGSLLEGGTALFENSSGFSRFNLGPSVDAGEDAAVAAGFPHTLDGFVTDDGFPDPPGSFGVDWSLAEGPASVILDDAIMAVTDVNCQAAGEHVLRLVADDGAIRTFDDVVLTAFINSPPVFSAATLTPANAVALIPYSGQSLADFASDPNLIQGDLLTYTKLSGPSWIAVAADGSLTGTAAIEDIGFAFFNVRVTDAAGMFADATVQLVITSAVLYLDTNGSAAGSGASATVTWDSSAIWSTSAVGDGPTYGWADGALAVFSAGDDAIDSTITVAGSRLIAGFIVEEGEPSLGGGTLLLAEPITEFMIVDKAMIASTIAGVGNGIFKSGDGELELSANNTFSGAVTVSAGSLVLNGSLDQVSGLSVDPGATLSGDGSVDAAVAVSGVISPGDGVGALTIGALAFANGARLEWQAGDWSEPASGHDLLTAASVDLTDVTDLTIGLDDQHLTEFAETAASFVVISCPVPITGFVEENIIIDATNFTSALGTWSVRVDGNDLMLDYTPPPPFELWLLANFGPEPRDLLLAGEMADPDHDSVPNLVEYALDTDPNLSGPAGYVWDFVTVEGIDYLRITITRNPAATDVTYTVQTTSDLTDPESWTDLDTHIITNTPEELIVRDTLGGVKRFIRLRVSR